MKPRLTKIILLALLFVSWAGIVFADVPDGQLQSLFVQANDTFRQANSAGEPKRAKALYEKAILTYERIINEGNIHNPRLYYNLANAYLLDDDIGRAILNYRRAEKLDSSNADIQKNLNFARGRRFDEVAVKTERRVLQTLFFWHYDFSLKIRMVFSCIFFGVLCLTATIMLWRKAEVVIKTTIFIATLLMVCFVTSTLIGASQQANQLYGVITADEIIARQGDGQNYEPSFKEPLHAGTEFDLIEQRPGWFHIELANGNDTWIPRNYAELI